MTTQTLEVFLDSIFYNTHLHSATISFKRDTAPTILKEYLDANYKWTSVSIIYGHKYEQYEFSWLKELRLDRYQLNIYHMKEYI